jgi:ribosome-binding protein aMBF1 (putative translation factor)
VDYSTIGEALTGSGDRPFVSGLCPSLRDPEDAYRVFPIPTEYRENAIRLRYRENTIEEGAMVTRTARLRVPADFGLAIQQSRLARGLSQAELAAELDIPQSTISEIESGKSTIYLRRLLNIARVTGLDFTASWEDEKTTRR